MNSDGSSRLDFCPYCGTGLLDAAQRFCGSCGRPLPAPVTTASAAAATATKPPASPAADEPAAGEEPGDSAPPSSDGDPSADKPAAAGDRRTVRIAPKSVAIAAALPAAGWIGASILIALLVPEFGMMSLPVVGSLLAGLGLSVSAGVAVAGLSAPLFDLTAWLAPLGSLVGLGALAAIGVRLGGRADDADPRSAVTFALSATVAAWVVIVLASIATGAAFMLDLSKLGGAAAGTLSSTLKDLIYGLGAGASLLANAGLPLAAAAGR